MSKVSILMNAYNAEKYLKEALDSIYNQTYTDWEIIFIDNCSTDSTKEIVDNYDDKIRYYKTNSTISLGAARNFGLQYCNSDYLAFLDTDDIWLKNKLIAQIEVMDNDYSFQLCYSGVIFIDDKSKEIGSLVPVGKSGNVFGQQLTRYEINMQSVLVRNNINLVFNVDLKHSPDYDLFMRITCEYKVFVTRKTLVKYRKLTNSLTSKNINVWGKEMEFTLNKLFKNNQQLKNRYKKEYKLAYAKVAYYKAQYYISINHRLNANKVLSKFKFASFKYSILYLMTYSKYVWDLIHKVLK